MNNEMNHDPFAPPEPPVELPDGVEMASAEDPGLPAPTSSKIDEVKRELADRQALSNYLGPLKELEAKVHRARDEVKDDAVLAFVEDQDARTIRESTVPALKKAFEGFEAEKARLEAALRSGDESPKSQKRLLAQAKEKLDAEIQRWETVVEGCAEKLLGRFGKEAVRAPSVETNTKATLVFAGFDAKLPGTNLAEAEAVLQIAKNPDASPAEQFEADQLLSLCYGPLVKRMAESPPRHARGLQPAFAKLDGLIETHLDTTVRGVRHRIATRWTDQIRQELRFVTITAKRSGWDDFVLSTAAPFFQWDD